MKKIKIAYCRDNIESATSVLRYLAPAKFMEDSGLAETFMIGRVEFSPSGRIMTSEVREADVVVMGQVIYKADFEIAKLFKKQGKKLAIDADDLYFENGYKDFTKETLDCCKNIALLADVVTVCSPYLGKQYEKIGVKPEKIKYIPNYALVSDWEYWWKKRELQRFTVKKDGRIRIGMMGGTAHVRDWVLVYPVLEKVVKKYGDKIKLEIMGMPQDTMTYVLNNKNASASVMNAVVEGHNLYKDLGAEFLPHKKYEGFYSYMCKIGWDIGLAPLSNDRTTKSKSYLKYLDYGLAHIAGIYQGISPFTDVIEGHNGISANTKEDWFKSICTLIENEQLRKEIVENALEDIKENHDIKNGWKDYLKAYQSVL